MKYIIVVSLLFLVSCATHQSIDKAFESSSQDGDVGGVEELSRDDRIYFFQHKLMPNWLYESDGVFFSSLQNGNATMLFQAAEEIIDFDFSSSIQIDYIEESEAVVFTFEHPSSPPNCFYSIAIKLADGRYKYFTYESTVPFGDKDIAGVVGSWDSNGDHGNLGTRTYTALESFKKEILKL